jgi:hypothetical protein
MLRTGLSLAFCLMVAAASGATPLDTAYDMLDALEWGDAEGVMELLSTDVRARVTASLDGLRQLAGQSPEAASDLLRRLDLGLAPSDLEGMTGTELLAVVMERRRLRFEVPPVEREHVTMSGRTAQVGLALMGGDSIHMSMVWEEGGWRVSGSRLMDRLLAGIGR